MTSYNLSAESPIASRIEHEAHAGNRDTCNSRKVPLAIFTYNRPLHTRRLLESVGRNSRLDELDIWIFCDAPKRPECAADVEKTRDIVHEWAARMGATVRESNTNLGIARSVVAAVGRLIDEYGTVIVLEDDLVIAPDFVNFMLEGLCRYADCARVMQVSGHLHIENGKARTSGLFMPLSTSWGWATWARAWEHMKLGDQISTSELDADSLFRSRLTVEGACPFFEELLRECLQHPGEVWAIFWWYAIAKADGLVLYPNHSLVWNGGFDGTGVHCGLLDGHGRTMPAGYDSPRLDPKLQWPPAMEVDASTFERTKLKLELMFGRASYMSRIRSRVLALGQRLRANYFS